MSQAKDGRGGKCCCGGGCKSITPDRIRQRAYEIFRARNGAPGDAGADWLAAERELEAGAKTEPTASAPAAAARTPAP